MIRFVLYDITANRPRTRIADLLLRHGFERIQYSVFVGRIPSTRWKRLWRELEQYFSADCAPTDRIYSIVVDQKRFEAMDILGEVLPVDWILQETEVWFVGD